jgi:hypothetical protein
VRDHQRSCGRGRRGHRTYLVPLARASGVRACVRLREDLDVRALRAGLVGQARAVEGAAGLALGEDRGGGAGGEGGDEGEGEAHGDEAGGLEWGWREEWGVSEEASSEVWWLGRLAFMQSAPPRSVGRIVDRQARSDTQGIAESATRPIAACEQRACTQS